MKWQQLMADFDHKTNVSFVLTFEGPFGKPKQVKLEMSNNTHVFSSLGTGSMKRVVRVEKTSWVLAIAGDSPGAEQDIEGEVKTLCDLHKRGLNVPAPFNEANEKDIIFKMKIQSEDNEPALYPAFIQEFLEGCDEMPKLQGAADFMKDKVVPGDKIPLTIEQTKTDLAKIRDELIKKEWGDFQVMYQRATGKLIVFDPLPENNSGKSSVSLVEGWIKDIEEAEKRATAK